MNRKAELISDGNRFSKQVLRYTLLFVVTALCTYALFIVLPRTFLSNADGNIDGIAQHYPIYSEIKRNIGGLLTGQSWSWDIGLGDDALMEFSTKILNPLTYLVIVFPQKYLDVGFTLMVLVSQYLSGLSFLIFGRKIGFDYRQNITGGICYAFSGWVIQSILRQGTFLMATILFPLLMLGLEKLLRKESPLLFILTVAAHVIYSMQWAYASAIAVLMYMAVRLLTGGKDLPSGLDARTAAARTILSGIAGILIAGPMLLWSLTKVLGTTTASAVEDPLLYPLSQYFEIPTGFFLTTPTTNAYTVLGVPALCMILIPLVMKGVKSKSPQAIMALGLFILSLLPATGSLFNGMSYSVGRWFYILVFFMIWSCMDQYKPETFRDSGNIRTMAIWVLCLAVWGIGICYLLLGVIDFTKALTVFGGSLMGIMFIMVFSKGGLEKGRKYGILITAMLIVSITGYVNTNLFPGLGEQIHTLCQVGRIERDFSGSTQRAGVELQKEEAGFYRTDQVDGYTDTRIARVRANENMYFANRSIYTYLSTMDRRWHKFNKAMGNNAGYFDRTTSYSNDNREGLDYLLGVQFFLGDNPDMKPGASDYAAYGFEPYTTIDDIEVLRNKYDTGLGMAYSRYITETELMEYSPLEREQVMLQAAVVPDEAAEALAESGLKHAERSEIKTEVNEIGVGLSGFENAEIAGTQDGGTLSIHNDGGEPGSFDIELPQLQNCRVMLAFEDFVRRDCDFDTELNLKGKTFKGNKLSEAVKRVSYVDDEKFKIEVSRDDIVKAAQMRKGKNQGFADVKDFYINLGYFDSIEGKVHVNIDRVGEYDFGSIKAYAVPVGIYDEAVPELEKNIYRVSSFDGSSVKGNIDLDEDSLLYLSILESNGWNVWVDGEKLGSDKIIEDTNLAFTGVMIPAGSHELELRYKTPYMAQGFAMSLAGIILAFVLVKKSRREEKEENA